MGALYPGGKKSGNAYQIGAFGTSCTLATTWVKVFYVRRSPGDFKALSGAPRGYVCLARAPAGKLVYSGSCKKGQIGFTWVAKTY